MATTMNEPNGVLIVNKHAGVTSHDIVGKIRKLYQTKRVGHTGTLDPMATGVLVILIGRAAKACEYITSDKKQYIAGMKLGITTDTEDITGKMLTTADKIPSEDEVFHMLPKFQGDILQVPPMYSAIKVDGQKLYDLARKGITIEREARPITIFSLIGKKESIDTYSLQVECSAGTYIRTLCADIGQALGCGAVMSSLNRTYCGGFSIENSYTIDDLEKMSYEERLSLLLPTENLFSDAPRVVLSSFYEKLCRNGCEIYLQKIKQTFPLHQRVRISTENGLFFALGEVLEFENGLAIKPIKFFDLSM